jgi:hypothetical protein
MLGLDVSAHVGYFTARGDPYTDTTGFTYGEAKVHTGDVGARAKLLAAFPVNQLIWMPYVAATVDRNFDYSTTASIPDQPGFLGGDFYTIFQAKTFWGVEGGLDVRGPYGWLVGIKGFYSGSSDTSVTGGSLILKMPLWPAPG